MWSDPTFYVAFTFIAVPFAAFGLDTWLAWRRGTPPPTFQRRCRHCCCECASHHGTDGTAGMATS